MNLLSTIMPGIREFRIPAVCGALWLLCAAVLLRPVASDAQHWQIVDDWRPVTSALSTTLILSALVTAAYLVGIVTTELASAFGSWASRRFTPVPEINDGELTRRQHLAWRFGSGVSGKAVRLVSRAVEQRVAKKSSTVATDAPLAAFLDDLELAAIRLQKESPDLWQQYDRLRSEAEFRLQISLPLATFLIIVGSKLPWPWVAVLIFVAVVVIGLLYLQGIRKLQEANEWIATTLYFGYTSIPLLDAYVVEAPAGSDNQAGRVSGSAFALTFMARNNASRDISVQVIRLRHPSRGKDYLDQVLAEVPDAVKTQFKFLTSDSP